MVSTATQTATVWTRRDLSARCADGGELRIARYHPGTVSVEYEPLEGGGVRLKRVLVYSDHENPARRRLLGTHRSLPAQYRAVVLRAIAEAEQASGRYPASVVLPSGESLPIG